MRISDWISDVCSSDLPAQLLGKLPRGFSTRNAEMPLCGFAASTGSVRASTRMASALSALVHQYLLPVINQSSPSRSARVERPEMSDPVPGSDMEKAKIKIGRAAGRERVGQYG